MSDQNKSCIRITDLKKTFDGKDFVLDGINLEIPCGLITVLIGFSGTGKSVLLKHILGLLKPSSGNVEVLGHQYSSMDDKEITLFRRNFGVLFQNAALFDDMTVIENVLFPLQEHHRGNMKIQRMRDLASSRLKLVGIEEKHFLKLPNELSGGMRKRVGLARAIALDPEILLYDEPTTGLDPIMTEMVDNLVLNTHKHREGLTSVIVTHDLFAALRIGDHLAMLDNGKILLHGTPKDFMESDNELVRKFVDKGVRK
jgi:phospholipid/cholesterol/gamma-HCH transport system ATP-binding protein